ncbi:rhomboid-like protein [Streptomyces sp. AC495_CC817]|uniref:rhomboid-like protein n=1 Tax=Streptomyces sp. AC495_CC817 TaxID=2823900 RepID=UPI0020B8F7FE|nr:rhomboid-like protein [Streptomyces sp. AC495_CC817]
MDAAETVETAGPVLDGIPRQPGATPGREPVAHVELVAHAVESEVCGPPSEAYVVRSEACTVEPGVEPGVERGVEPGTRAGAASAQSRRAPFPRPWRLLPTPVRTPFTFFYATLLALTSLVAEHVDPDLVRALHQGSSTDVAHLVHSPVPVLVASALWVAGGVGSVYVFAFVLVLTALERRIGGWRTAGVFLLGHVLATLVTEVPVGLAVLVGHLPDSSLHRLDYGISFGVAASAGALAGLLPPWLRWPLLLGFGGMLLDDLLAFADPMTNWGHLLSLAIGVAMWPVVREWHRPSGSAGEPRARQRGRHGPAQ